MQPVLVLPILSIVEGTNKFPFPLMHRHGRREPFGSISMSGHKGKHGLTLIGFTFQGLGKIDTVDYMVIRVTHV